jgi:vancomycin resistance protein YoaR
MRDSKQSNNRRSPQGGSSPARRPSSRSVPKKRTSPAGSKTARLHAQKNVSTKTQGNRRASVPDRKRVTRGNSTSVGRFRRVCNTPRKRALAFVVIAIAVVFLIFGAVDTITTVGRIHQGVRIAGINVGGMSKENAADLLTQELGTRLQDGAVVIYASSEAQDIYAKNNTLDDTAANEPETYEDSSILFTVKNSDTPSDSSWATMATVLGASVNGSYLAEKAYSVGRGENAFAERLKAWFGGVDVQPELTFDNTALSNALDVINSTIGTPYTNADIAIDGGEVTTTEAENGYLVQEADFRLALAQAFLSNTRSFVVTIKTTAPLINDAQAITVAATVREAIARSISVHYMGKIWEMDTSVLGDCISTQIVSDKGSNTLVPYADKTKTVQMLTKTLGTYAGSNASDAYFDVSSGTPVLIPSQTGIGPMLDKGVNGVQAVLFGNTYRTEQREVVLLPGVIEPAITTSDAESMGIVENISTFTTNFNASDNANRTYNIIHLANDILDYCYIAPHTTWSFNEAAGDCTLERGFKLSTAYVEGMHTEQAGGGICQVATTIFNAAYEAGLPIDERHNHSLYSDNYYSIPDATVSYPSPDLKFTNETDNWILMTIYADAESTTVSLWGTSPNYTVTSAWGAWQDGTKAIARTVYDSSYPVGYSNIIQSACDGRSVTLTRLVTKDGVKVRTDTFKSVYNATDEITVVGTKT